MPSLLALEAGDDSRSGDDSLALAGTWKLGTTTSRVSDALCGLARAHGHAVGLSFTYFGQGRAPFCALIARVGA